MFKIEKNVLQDQVATSTGKYPFARMEVGDSFFYCRRCRCCQN